MATKLVRKTLGAISLSIMAATSQAGNIALETASSHSVVGIMPQTMASYWSKSGVDVQVTMGQTLTKSLLKVPSGKLDSAVVPTPAYYALKAGKGPYAKIGSDNGAEMASNVRGLFGFPASYYHAITWADSGINSWEEAKGARVYVGPPAGAANAQIRKLAAAGGLKEGEYQEVKAPWGAAGQGFQDGQYDVYVGAYSLGSQALVELSMQRPIRLLSVKEENAGQAGPMGMAAVTINPGIYPGQVNKEPVHTWQTLMFIAVNKDMDDETAYQLTKTYFEKRAKMAESNELLKDFVEADPFNGMVAPIHPGAMRYYKEAGMKVPSAH